MGINQEKGSDPFLRAELGLGRFYAEVAGGGEHGLGVVRQREVHSDVVQVDQLLGCVGVEVVDPDAGVPTDRRFDFTVWGAGVRGRGVYKTVFISGRVASAISAANAYRTQVVEQANAQAETFTRLLPEYRKNPRIVN